MTNKECKYCYREIDNSGLEGFKCTNKTVNMETSWCRPKNANMPCTICEYCKPREEMEMEMTNEEAIERIQSIKSKVSLYVDVLALRMAEEAIKNQKTGYWIENAPEWQSIDPPYICSECGNFHLQKTNYCDQCGVKMKGE